MIISLLGAESTGKSTLAAALHRHLLAASATLPAELALPTITHVPEYLRSWCLQHGRNPRQDEQAHIAHTQTEHLTSAAHPVGCAPCWVIADTTPWMTAVYSDHYFGDSTLYAQAQPLHREPLAAQPTPEPGSSGNALPPLNLLMGLDLPWAADGALRDGPTTQQAIDNRLRQQLDRWQCPYQTIYGSGTARVAAALQAISYHLTPHLHVDSRINAWQIAIKSEAEYSINESVSSQKNVKYASACDCCDDTASERQTFSRLLAGKRAPPASVGP